MSHIPLVCQCFADGVEQDVTPRLRRCAIEARRAGFSAEDLVVAIRDAWRALPEEQRWAPGHQAVLTDFINVALETYDGQASGLFADG
jgi:hypothetical protein